MDKVRELGLDQNTLVFYTTDNGAWQDVYPDAGYTPFRGTKGTVREGGNRVPAIAWMPGRIEANSKNHDILGGLDLMATFASVAEIELPENDRERSEEHTSELQSLMRISYAAFGLTKKTHNNTTNNATEPAKDH